MVVIRYLAARYELWCSVAARYKTFTNPNHIQVTRVILFIRLLRVCLLSLSIFLQLMLQFIEKKVKVIEMLDADASMNWKESESGLKSASDWSETRVFVADSSWATVQPPRRQNGTILGKFRWKTKTSCFDAKLVLTQLRQLKSAGEAMLKTSCFARRGVQQQH